VNKFIVIAFLVLYGTCFGQETKVYGVAKEYADQELQFYAYEDYLTKAIEEIGTCTVGADGAFSCNLNIRATCQVYVNLGTIKGTLYVEQGKSYELVLPPYEPVTLVHELNPYFESNELMLGIKNIDTLGVNYSIFSFDDNYGSFIEQNFGYLYFSADVAMIDSVTKAYDSLYSYLDSGSYVRNYIFYKLAMLKHMTYERDLMYATRTYLLNKKILYHNPAFMHFFAQLFKDYFVEDHLFEYGSKIVDAIKYYKSPTMLKEVLEEKIAFRNDTLKELIILQGIIDAYNNPEIYPRNTVDITLDSLLLLTKIPEHKIIAENVKKKQKKLVPGDFAPAFELEDMHGNKVTLNDFEGRYIYLMFCRCESYTCQEDYKLISSLYDEQLPNLEIVTVGFEENKAVLQDFLTKNDTYKWQFLFAGKENPIRQNYQVKAMPSYILIDPDKRIAILPAPSPHENFKWFYQQTVYWREQAKKMDKAREEEQSRFR